MFHFSETLSNNCLWISVPQMKENCVKMQEISIGLQRLQPMELACKENIHGAGGPRSRKPTPLAFGISGEGGSCTFGEFPTQLANLHPQVPSNPLPRLSWANSGELWQRMRAKDSTRAAPEAEVRMRHPNILPNMRTILLDWMIEVCRNCIQKVGGIVLEGGLIVHKYVWAAVTIMNTCSLFVMSLSRAHTTSAKI